MDESILDSIKKLVNLDPDDTSFDIDVIMHINSTFFTLQQLGVGPLTGFAVWDRQAKWSDFISAGTNMNAVKSYMALKVRMLFDPPTLSFVLDAMTKQAAEFEWRLNIEAETYPIAPPESWWLVPVGGDFPAEAPYLAIGYTPETGQVWRNE